VKRAPALALVVLVAAGCGGGGPHFRATAGWHVGADRAYSWASTIPYRDCRNCVPPHETLAALPPGGILIQLATFRERGSSRTRSWPPRIRARDVSAGFEGVPRRYGVFQFTAQTGRFDRSLYVWFGRAHPTPGQLERANAELARVTS
jgi:hypothetical protein